MSAPTWREMIVDEMEEHGETLVDVIGSAVTTKRDADTQYLEELTGCDWESRKKPFTIWTHNRVYFPACYDGGTWVASVPRNPCDEKTEPVGG